MGKVKHSLRPMRQAARAGDHSAARALLKLYGFDELAAEIKRNLPFSNRVRRQLLALTAGTGEGDQLTDWEYRDESGEIESLLLHDPPSPRSKAPRVVLFDD
jgi:hypothetical protein